MSFDLSWLWNLLNNIASTIQSWFSSLWSATQNIVNTGQGIFSGLVAFGSQIWDAIIKAFQTLGEWISSAFSWIYNGLKYVSDVLGQWISTAFNWIGSGLNWIAQQIYNFGQWLWNGLCWIGDVIRNALIGLWNWITNTISGIATAIGNWWSGVINGINAWFTNLLKVFRQKIVTTIMADIAISGMWKAGERILNPTKLKDIGYGLLGIGLSPLIGYAIGKFIDALVPLPSTEPYPLIPSISGFAYTPPSLDITRPELPSAPSMGTSPSPPGYFPGIVIFTLTPLASYDWSTATPATTTTPITLTTTQTLDSTDNKALILLSYETELS